jgi:hypothetical protein
MSLNLQRLLPLVIACRSGCYRFVSQRLPPLLSLLVAAVATALCRSGCHRSVRFHYALWWQCSSFFVFQKFGLLAFRSSRRFSIRSMAAEEPTTYFYPAECPLAAECQSGSWRNAKIWGWSEEECRGRLKLHLMNSGLHKCTDAEADALCESCPLEIDEHTAPPPSKKQKHQPAIGARRGQLQLATPSSSSSGSDGVVIKKEHLKQVFRHSNDFAH